MQLLEYSEMIRPKDDLENAKLMECPVMVGLREAARRTGISYDALLQMCHDKRIAHIRTGKKFLINYTWLVEYLNTAGKED